MQDKRLMGNSYAAARPAVEINKVLKNTYMLLGMTLLFSAACAGVAVMTNMPPMGIVVTLVTTGLLACIIPARSATRTDPVDAMRE